MSCGSFASHLVFAHTLVHLCVNASFPQTPAPPTHTAAFSQDPAGFLHPGNLAPGLETESQDGPEMAQCCHTMSKQGKPWERDKMGYKHRTGTMLSIQTSPGPV